MVTSYSHGVGQYSFYFSVTRLRYALKTLSNVAVHYKVRVNHNLDWYEGSLEGCKRDAARALRRALIGQAFSLTRITSRKGPWFPTSLQVGERSLIPIDGYASSRRDLGRFVGNLSYLMTPGWAIWDGWRETSMQYHNFPPLFILVALALFLRLRRAAIYENKRLSKGFYTNLRWEAIALDDFGRETLIKNTMSSISKSEVEDLIQSWKCV